MMEILMFVLAWYALGALGAALMFECQWRDEIDVQLRDVGAGAIFALLGPLALGVGLICLIAWLAGRAGGAVMRLQGWSPSTIVRPRRKHRN